jgi:integrase/recombinase XerD
MNGPIDEFECYLNDVKCVSKNTLCSYLGDVRKFAAFLGLDDADSLCHVQTEDARRYVADLQESGRSAATISRAIASLRCFFEYFIKTGALESNPIDSVTSAKPEKKLPSVLTGEEVELLLEQPRCVDPKGYRDKAALELLYATGIRVTELITMDIENVNLTTRLVRCPGDGREIPLYTAAVRAIADYLSLAREHMAAPGETALFVNTTGFRMSRQGFWKLVKYYQEKAGITKEITPNVLRHSFAAHLLAGGADIQQVKAMMGHTDIASTQVYALVVQQRLKDAYQRAHPRAR